MNRIIFKLICFWCKYFGMDPIMVFAIGMAESGFMDNEKYRYEPAFYKKYINGKEKYKSFAPEYISASFGYFQIMTTTAEMVGYDLHRNDILNDFVNIYYAIKYMRSLLDKYHALKFDWISAYNAGHPKNEGNKGSLDYENIDYVSKVLNFCDSIQTQGLPVEGTRVFIQT